MEPQQLNPDPIEQFRLWLEEAKQGAGLEFPNAVALATASKLGAPSVRMVLLKGLDARGFVFFTNYESRKAQELLANPQAALCFHWEELGRSVRVEGTTEKTSPEESERYFATRPRESRIGSWASPQSRELAGREVLEKNVSELHQRFGHSGDIPRPPHWGGFRLLPSRVEFWSNGANRLHDRVVYELDGKSKKWRLFRLAP